MKGEIHGAILASIFVGITSFASIAFSEPLFCTDPVLAVCQEQRSPFLDPPNPQEARWIDEARQAASHSEPSIQMAVQSLFIEREILKTYPQAKLKTERLFYQAIKLIAQVLDRFDYIPRFTRQRMMEQLQKTDWIVASEFLSSFADTEESNRNESNYDLDFVQACGVLRVLPTAFANHTYRKIVVCPGALLVAGQDEAGSRSALLRTLTHELGHFINSDFFGNTFEPMTQCLRKKDLPEYDGTPESENFLSDQVSEITADFWAAETVAATINPQASSEALDRLIQATYQNLCGLKGGSQHPDGNYRIGITAGENSSLRNALGCRASFEAEASCSLKANSTPLQPLPL